MSTRYWSRGVGALSVLVCLISGGCNDDEAARNAPDGGHDATSETDAVSEGVMKTCAAGCLAGQICYQPTDRCVADLGACDTDEDCLNDSFCHQGHCLPYAAETKIKDPQCQARFESSAFEIPTVKCHWDKAPVISSPVIIDLDGDQVPEVVFVTWAGNHQTPGNLVALRGDNCTELFNKAVGLGPCSHLAAADLTQDGVPELVGITPDKKVVVLDHQGQVLATSSAALAPIASNTSCGGPAIANVDGQEPPEIIYGGLVLRLVNGQLEQLFHEPVSAGNWGYLSCVADVDLDGAPEVITPNRILDGKTGQDKSPAAIKSFAGGYLAVAQLDESTPEPEVVLITSSASTAGQILVFHPKSGAIVFGPYTFSTYWGGPPTVADFDGDGKPEVGVAGYTSYVVFDPECAAEPLPAFCSEPGIRWLKQTQDTSSGSTGSSVFDFNGDGQAEVVYRDECWVRAYDGASGKILFAQSVSSCTALEYPVIADLDQDGHADMVVAADHICNISCTTESELGLTHGGPSQGIYIFEDPKDRWMPSRPIWNQHTYHITNINADGTVPLVEEYSWKDWNSYRQNSWTTPQSPGSDLTVRWHQQVDSFTECESLWVLQVDVCNRGAIKVPAGVSGTFYHGDPAQGGQSICTVQTDEQLEPGGCTMVKCDWSDPPRDKIDLYFLVDDSESIAECKELNNTMHFYEKCPGPCDPDLPCEVD